MLAKLWPHGDGKRAYLVFSDHYLEYWNTSFVVYALRVGESSESILFLAMVKFQLSVGQKRAILGSIIHFRLTHWPLRNLHDILDM